MSSRSPARLLSFLTHQTPTLWKALDRRCWPLASSACQPGEGAGRSYAKCRCKNPAFNKDSEKDDPSRKKKEDRCIKEKKAKCDILTCKSDIPLNRLGKCPPKEEKPDDDNKEKRGCVLGKGCAVKKK